MMVSDSVKKYTIAQPYIKNRCDRKRANFHSQFQEKGNTHQL